jgi:Secretion system C-terminal sorting domain/Matrixin/IPT/TIG domain
MKSTSTIRTFIFALAIFSHAICSLHAQLYHVPLEKRMATAQLVFEGEVIHSSSYYGDNGNIYTSHIVRIDKVIKGSPATTTLEIILEGGTVGDKSLWISHHLILGPKSSGVFFLNPLGVAHPAKLGQQRLAYDVYADSQGFIEYMAQPGATIAVEPFHVYRSIATDLYPLLGLSEAQAPMKHKPIPLRIAGGPIIDSIRPLEVTAGTRTTLSIYGSGFQDGKGSVLFPNANSGGITLMVSDSTDIQAWADTLIRVRVPSIGGLPFLTGVAGTGFVSIANTLGDTARSLDTLRVRFGIKNVRNEDTLFPIGVSQFASLFDQDSHVPSDTTGGYTFRLSDSFSASDSAEAVFRQSLRQWRCATGVNFKIGVDTSLNAAQNDLVNIVRWDDFPDTLPAGRLARTRLYFVDCVVGPEHAYQISEIDFTFNRDIPWNFDTTAITPTKVDFYSVTLHETGHAHGLEHVIDNSEVMNYNIGFGDRNAQLTLRTLEGGQWMMDSSTVARGNCYDPMIAVAGNDCNMLPIAASLENSMHLRLFPNPTANLLNIELIGANAIREISFSLFDANGICIPELQYELQRLSKTTWKVDLKDLPSGMYLARLGCNSSYSNHKIIKLR